MIKAALNSLLFQKVNVKGTRNLLECARWIIGVKAFVYTSSASVVHDSVSDLYNANEQLPVLRMPQEKDLYSHTKALAKDLVLAANCQHGILIVLLRPAGIHREKDVLIISNMFKAYKTGKTQFQLGNNANFFNFINVNNVAHAHILAMQKLMDIY